MLLQDCDQEFEPVCGGGQQKKSVANKTMAGTEQAGLVDRASRQLDRAGGRLNRAGGQLNRTEKLDRVGRGPTRPGGQSEEHNFCDSGLLVQTDRRPEWTGLGGSLSPASRSR